MSQAEPFTLSDLERRVAERALASPEDSWTARLVAAGPARVAKKLGEEGVEAALALVSGDKGALTAEAADLIYHLMVALRVGDVALQDVLDELERRTARTGLAEKAARPDAGS